MNARRISAQSSDHRITVRLDPAMHQSIQQLLQAAEADDRQRCKIIRELLNVALGKQQAVLIVRLGVLDDTELRALSAKATSVSDGCYALRNALRDLPAMGSENGELLAQWQSCIERCYQSADSADTLVAEIASFVRRRSLPPKEALHAIQALKSFSTQQLEDGVDAEKELELRKRISILEAYVESVKWHNNSSSAAP